MKDHLFGNGACRAGENFATLRQLTGDLAHELIGEMMTITLESIAKHGIDDTLTTEEIAYLLATQEELERLRRLEKAVAAIWPSDEEREEVLRDEGEAMPSLSWYVREAGLGSWGSECVSDWIYGIADALEE